MIKSQLKIVAASAAAGAAVVIVGAVAIVMHVRKRKRKNGQFLSNKTRKTITEAIQLAGEEIPHGPVGASLFEKHLDGLSDKRLLALYGAVRIGEFIHESNIDPEHVTSEQLELIRSRFAKAQEEERGNREGMLSALRSHDIRDLKPLLVAALAILAIA